MRAPLLLLVLLVAGCANAENVAPASFAPPLAPPPMPVAEPPPPAISHTEIGADRPDAEWAELAMPDDARVSSFAQTVGSTRETWTLAAAGARRVLRLRVEEGKRIAWAAWGGTMTSDGMALRLVELRGDIRIPAEHLTGTCRRDAVCEEGNPKHRVAVEMCSIVEEGEPRSGAQMLFFASGNGVDFMLGTCPSYAMSRRR